MNDPLRLYVDRFDTPVGPMTVVVDDRRRLHAAGWADGHGRMRRQLNTYAATSIELTPASNPGGVTAIVRAYFDGDLAAVEALSVADAGTTFQRTVWAALREIPFGETCSYGELARRVGRPAAVRAVGLANGANPVAVVVPCHRVIGTDGSLTGYGGGLRRKQWLLAHEGRRGVTLALPSAHFP